MILQMKLEDIKRAGELAVQKLCTDALQKLDLVVAEKDQQLNETWENEQRGRYLPGSYEREAKEAEAEKIKAYNEYRNTVKMGLDLVKSKMLSDVAEATSCHKLGAVDRATIMTAFNGNTKEGQVLLLDSLKDSDFELTQLLCERFGQDQSDLNEVEYVEQKPLYDSVADIKYHVSKRSGKGMAGSIDILREWFDATEFMTKDLETVAVLPTTISLDNTNAMTYHNYKHQTPYQKNMSAITNNIE